MTITNPLATAFCPMCQYTKFALILPLLGCVKLEPRQPVEIVLMHHNQNGREIEWIAQVDADVFDAANTSKEKLANALLGYAGAVGEDVITAAFEGLFGQPLSLPSRERQRSQRFIDECDPGIRRVLLNGFEIIQKDVTDDVEIVLTRRTIKVEAEKHCRG